jgi:hypothetical protein
LASVVKDMSDQDNYRSGRKENKEWEFTEYVRRIDSYPDESFDVILIDGRSRPSCIKHAICKLKVGGAIILDNADRERYNLAKRKYLSGFKSIRFVGIGPYSPMAWETAVYLR